MTRTVPGSSAAQASPQPELTKPPQPEPPQPEPPQPEPSQPNHLTQPHPPGPGSPPPPRPRRWPDPSFGAILAVGAGLLLVWLHHPRMGLYFIAAVLAVGAGLRLLLPARSAGLLVVRGRSFDVAVLGLLAVGMFVVASVTHFPRPGP